LTWNVQVPRWISAIWGAAGSAGVKSAASQPAVTPGVAGGGMRMSATGTRRPVTSPLPEYCIVRVSYVAAVGDTCASTGGARLRKNGNVNSWRVTC
jgi:hypothetical protein